MVEYISLKCVVGDIYYIDKLGFNINDSKFYLIYKFELEERLWYIIYYCNS